MNIIKGLKYSKSHEWVKVDGELAYIGITDHAQSSLGDIVFVELPELNKKLTAGGTLGVIESVKSASDVYSPVSGTVVSVNEGLSESPEKINEEPYESWFVAVRITNLSELDNLMDENEYEKFCLKEG